MTDAATPLPLHRLVLEQIRVLVVAGIGTGAIVVGVGSRLAMLALRLTSPGSVIGRQSDDDFTIGEFTISGTYNLLLLGAAVGIVGVAAYQCVAPRLIGPLWFRRSTVALASGVVVGSMLVHADGIDFRVLKPMWFAIGLFVLLPALFGAAIGAVVDRVSLLASSSARGRRRWILPGVLFACFPLTIILLAPGALIFTIWVGARERTPLMSWTRSRPATLVARAGWLGIAVLGLVALIGDVTALT
jgi:hypothetical protein